MGDPPKCDSSAILPNDVASGFRGEDALLLGEKNIDDSGEIASFRRRYTPASFYKKSLRLPACFSWR